MNDSNESLVDFILKRNEEQTQAFRTASARMSRTRYRAAHPTEFGALKCMDGRLHIALYTEIPTGIIQPFRNIGGRFDLGWPFFAESIRGWVNYCMNRGRRCVFLVTYHYSKGKKDRGCAGWKYDTAAARASAEQLAKQIERVFGASPRMVYPIVVGLETDEETLVLHGTDGTQMDLSALPQLEGIEEKVRDLYPDMELSMVRDLVPLLKGNWRHVQQIRASNRPPIELEHREQIIAVGRGFDWLHVPNKALIIGPYSHEWPDAVATAGKIVVGNLDEGRIPKDKGVLLLISSLSRDQEGSYGWNIAAEKAKYFERVAKAILEERVPQLSGILSVLTGVTFADTREFHVVSGDAGRRAQRVGRGD